MDVVHLRLSQSLWKLNNSSIIDGYPKVLSSQQRKHATWYWHIEIREALLKSWLRFHQIVQHLAKLCASPELKCLSKRKRAQSPADCRGGRFESHTRMPLNRAALLPFHSPAAFCALCSAVKAHQSERTILRASRALACCMYLSEPF